MRKSLLGKKLVASVLAFVLLLCAPIAALADDDHRGKHGGKHHKEQKHNKQHKQHYKVENGKLKGKMDVRWHFDDLDENWDWARKNIARLASKHIFEGYDDGTFRPNRPVTRLEALITAVRLMGLRDLAESEEEMNRNLNFKDADLIERKYPQAVGYVAVALKNDLFVETENKVQPEKAADRLWVATMLVKALGMDELAKTKMDAKLDFKDANNIPAGSVGYVAVAVENNIVYGTSDKKFQPNKPVTRAEIAAFLDRAGMHLPEYEDGAIRGTVSTTVQNNTLYLTVNRTQQPFALDPNAFIFRNGVKVQPSAIQIGDEVTVRTYNNLVIFVEVTKNAVEQVEPIMVSGQLTAKVSNDTITIERNNKQEQYAISKQAAIFRDGQVVAASELKIGDEIMIRVENNVVVWVLVTEKVEQNEFTVSGTFQGVGFNSEGRIATISITQAVSGNTQTSVYNTTDEVSIEGNIAQLVLNQNVELKGKDGLVYKIIVK